MTNDTEKAREYAQSPLGIRASVYGPFLDGRLSLRVEMNAVLAENAKLREVVNEIHTRSKFMGVCKKLNCDSCLDGILRIAELSGNDSHSRQSE